MKLGAKNLEWILIAGFVITILTEFLLLAGGAASNSPQTTMIHVFLLMTFAGQLIIAIILLRIYDAIVVLHGIQPVSKKKK